MHPIDLTILAVYFLAMVGIGWYFMRRNSGAEDFYLAGRGMGAGHIGLSVVATDVGGGFSIGLGGLGFVMGIAGSWMLFTGLIGAWLSAVVLIPRVKRLDESERFYTFPQLFGHFYGASAALLAGIISAIGYLGFTSSQILAGAKLAAASFRGLDQPTALFVMGGIVVLYTSLGGLKAVIYTDTIQWAVLMLGLIGIGIPIAYVSTGGIEGLRATLDAGFFDITRVNPVQLINWGVTIVPIWFVGMTLYQRIFATRSEKEAKRAWFMAGLFEWPVMAFMGVLLGLFARSAAEQGMFAGLGFTTAAAMDAEMGLPLLLRTVLPVGLIGLMVSAYFSAIMSTADSCLMAASGNVVGDIVSRIVPVDLESKAAMRLSQVATLVLGALALLLASMMQNVLDLMLYSYAFMVSGLLVPVIGIFARRSYRPAAALSSMLSGGLTTLGLTLVRDGALPGLGKLPLPLGLDPIIFGLAASALVFIFVGVTHEPAQEQVAYQ